MKKSFLVLFICATFAACTNNRTVPITQPTSTPSGTSTPRPTPTVSPTATPPPSPTPAKQVAFFAYYASHGVLPAKASRRPADGISWVANRLVRWNGLMGSGGSMIIQAIDGSGNPIAESGPPLLASSASWLQMTAAQPSDSALFADGWSGYFGPYNASPLENNPQTYTITATFPDVSGTATAYQYDGFLLSCSPTGPVTAITTTSGVAADTTPSGRGDIQMTNCQPGQNIGDITFPYGYEIVNHAKLDPWGSPFTYFTYVLQAGPFTSQGATIPVAQLPNDQYALIIYKDASGRLHKLMLAEQGAVDLEFMQQIADSTGGFAF